MKILSLSILIFLLSACSTNQEILPGNFDKKQWQYNSSYRYEITKTKAFFTMVEGKSRKEIRKLLGPPDLIDSASGSFVYCFDIPVKGSRCDASLLSINFIKGSPYNVIVVKCEPNY